MDDLVSIILHADGICEVYRIAPAGSPMPPPHPQWPQHVPLRITMLDGQVIHTDRLLWTSDTPIGPDSPAANASAIERV